MKPARIAVLLYRVASHVRLSKIPIVPKAIKWTAVWLTGIEIDPGCSIGKDFVLHHGYGSIISGTLGDNVHVNQGVTIGGNWDKADNGRRLPIIGSNVWIMAGAKILGPITIGDNVLVGANAVVIRDVPSNSVVAGVPARKIRDFTAEDLEHMNGG
jgi:serine O-acetyltransferase